MSDLSQQNNGATVIAENTEISLDWGAGNKTQGRITAPSLLNILSLSPVRKKKILEVRKQLVEGRYDIDGRLNVALDRLLEDLVV